MPPNSSLLFLDITSASSHHLCDSVSFRKSKLHIQGFLHCSSEHFPSQQQLASMETLHFLKLPLLLSCFLLAVVLSFSNFHVQALNIGVQAVDSSVTLSKDCSRKCESEFCSVPPFLRYGKYCGLLYSGCPGERPCDGLDACCMKHDACVQSSSSGYLSQECSQKLIACMNYFKSTGERTFKGNKCDPDEVIDVISVVMEAALLAGRVLHRP